MRGPIVGLCAAAVCAGALGADSVTVDDADLTLVTGSGNVEVVNGTEIYRYKNEDGSGWTALFARDEQAQSIELSAGSGTYDLQVWSIPSDPANPDRELSTQTIVIDDQGPQDPNVTQLLALLDAWGDCPGAGDCTNDLNGDGAINVSDLLILLGNW